jgi:hypothetical protein
VRPAHSQADSKPLAAPAAAFSSITASLSIDVSSMSSFEPASVELQAESATSAEQSDVDILILLDQAIAELDDSENEGPLADRSGDEEDYSELALAAVFDDESKWWAI